MPSSAGRDCSVRVARLVIRRQGPGVPVNRTIVTERCDDWAAELRDLRQCLAVDLDDELLEAVPEPSGERLVCLGDQDVSRTQRVRPVRALEPGVPAQRQVHRDRARGAALDDFPGAPDHVGGPADPGEVDAGQAQVEFCGDSGSLACTSSPISAVALCVSHSSTRRAAGSPTVENALGARSAGCIALPVRTLNELGNPWASRPVTRFMVISQPPGGYRDDLAIVTMSCHTTCGWPAARSGP